jgi:hypothetical protein
MKDGRPLNTKFNEPGVFLGRFTGAANLTPTTVTGTSKGMSLSRTNTGALTLTFTDPPLGVPQGFDAWVNSPANVKAVLVTPLPAPFVSPYTVTIQIAYATNAAAVDIVSTEELNIEAWFAITGNP